jgi:hypothetical protein
MDKMYHDLAKVEMYKPQTGARSVCNNPYTPAAGPHIPGTTLPITPVAALKEPYKLHDI